jgi:hypothetical protein
MRRTLVAATIVTALAAVGPEACAQDKNLRLPSPDPPGYWRAMTDVKATTTSRCIGKISTPLCAIETFLACYDRAKPSYCELAAPWHVASFGSIGPHIGGATRYRVLAASIGEDRRGMEFKWHDDVDKTVATSDPEAQTVTIWLEIQRCLPRLRDCSNLPYEHPYVLVRTKGGWRIYKHGIVR